MRGREGRVKWEDRLQEYVDWGWVGKWVVASSGLNEIEIPERILVVCNEHS